MGHDHTKIFTRLASGSGGEDTQSGSDLDALYQDLRGQATEAISTRDYYNSWGKHYLLSLATAHLHQFCNNFKDPGVQLYGRGSLFSETQETLDDIFAKVPPPVASRARRRKDWGGKGIGAVAPKPVQMAQVFNNRNAVCVHGDTEVTVKRSDVVSVIDVANVKKGD